jgi:hypothetical protein
VDCFLCRGSQPGDVATTWLISDAYSSPLENRSELLNGWWVCSVIDRLRALLADDLTEGTRVTAYTAPKSALRSPTRKVSADSSLIDYVGAVATFSPSKWTLAPTAAVRLVAQLFPESGPVEVDEFAGLAELISTHDYRHAVRPSERWELASPELPLSDLFAPDSRTLHRAAQLFKASNVEPGAVHAHQSRI